MQPHEDPRGASSAWLQHEAADPSPGHSVDSTASGCSQYSYSSTLDSWDSSLGLCRLQAFPAAADDARPAPTCGSWRTTPHAMHDSAAQSAQEQEQALPPAWPEPGTVMLAAALRAMMLQQAMGGGASSGGSAEWRIGTAIDSGGHEAAAAGATHAAAPPHASDPLVRAAQELVGRRHAEAAPGMLAAGGDAHAVLNSGAVLLLGQGSTTIACTNTQLSLGTVSVASSEGDSRAAAAHLASSAPAPAPAPAAAAAAAAACAYPHMPHLPPQAAAGRGGCGGGWAQQGTAGQQGRRRRAGLLVDCADGMQQLVAGGGCAAAGHASPPAPSAQGLGGQAGARAGAGAGRQLQVRQPQLGGCEHAAPASGSLTDSSAALASGDVLVLGQPSAPLPRLQARAAAAAAGAASACSRCTSPPGVGQGGHAKHPAAPQAVPPAAAPAPVPPVLQLLSCGSLASFMMSANAGGRSDSSLLGSAQALQPGGSAQALAAFLGTSGVLRLSSFTSQHQGGSFSSQHNSSFSSSQSEAAAAVPPPCAVGGSFTTHRPSPLPMLRENSSWGCHLNEAADGQQQQHPPAALPSPPLQPQLLAGVPARGRSLAAREAPGAGQPQQQVQQPAQHAPEQLIYLLD